MQLEQRAVVIGGKRIDAGLHIGEVLHEQLGHVGIEPAAIRHRRIGLGAIFWPAAACSRRHFDGAQPWDSRRNAMPWPTYQATRGNWLMP